MNDQLKNVQDALHLLCPDGVFEIRALGVPTGGDWTSTFSGYFDDTETAAGEAVNLDRKGAKGVYVTPNPVQPDLLARRNNTAKRCRKGDPLTKNDEIVRRRWLPLDFDPERPAGISSTDAELQAATDRAVEVARFLKGEGWPGGVLAQSGNGAHLMYRVDLPTDDQGLVKRVLQALDDQFSDDAVDVDTTVHNAARIWKLYGTTARKGDATDDRPHRRARILRVADPVVVVPTAKLQQLALDAETDRKHAPRNGASDGLSEREIERALHCIPPRPHYDNWFHIVAAVHDAVGGDVDAADRLLKAWSAEVKEGEYWRKLESGFDGSITVATLIDEAKKHGYTHPAKRNGQDVDDTPRWEPNAAEPEDRTPEADPFTLENAPPLPDDVFPDLPKILREPSFMFGRRHKRDVFLTGALGLFSGCLPNLEGYYGADVPSALGANLYGAVVAQTAGGKNALDHSKRLAAETDQTIRDAAETDRTDWQQRKQYAEETGEDFNEPEPPEQSLFVPANTSAAWLFRCLKDRGERGVLYSTEIDTLANSMQQEWGQHDALLRQAYHHEQASYGRKNEGASHWLSSPHVSVILSGTLHQFSDLMAGSTENGLYNRFLVYYFDQAEPWISQRPSPDKIDRLERLDELSGRVRDLYKVLAKRPDPLRFEMDTGQWEQRREVFAPLLRKARLLGVGSLEAVAFRAGIWAFRITMILAALRAFENGANLERASTLNPATCDVKAGLALTRVYADHALRFGSERLNAQKPDPRMKRIRMMLGGVGKRFGSGEAYEAYERVTPSGKQKSRRTLRRDLNHAEEQQLLRATSGNGQWEQISPGEENTAASDVSDMSDWRSEYEEDVGSDTSDTSDTAPTSGPTTKMQNNGHSSDNALETHTGNARFTAGDRVQTPKGAGTVVEPLEGGRVAVRLDDADTWERVSIFDADALEPISNADDPGQLLPF